MARTDEDTWDLAVSVGATATVLAVRRALASWLPNALFYDPFAEPLVSICRRLAIFLERPAVQQLPLTCSWRWLMPKRRRCGLLIRPRRACLRYVGLPRTHRGVGDVIMLGQRKREVSHACPRCRCAINDNMTRAGGMAFADSPKNASPRSDVVVGSLGIGDIGEQRPPS